MTDRKLWDTVDSMITRVAKWFGYIAAGSAGVMLVLAVTDVIGSKFFNHGILGTGEMIEELNIILVFMAVAYVQTERGHVRITIIERFLSPGASHVFRMCGYLMGVLIFAFMSWRSLVLFQKHLVVQATKEGAVRFLLWPFSLAMLMGLIMLTIVFISLFIKGIAVKSQ